MDIRHGATRHVLLVGCIALKIPRLTEWRLLLCGLLANMQERQFSRTGWPELCPVLWSIPGGWLVVMRRAREMTDDEFAGFDSLAWMTRTDGLVPVEEKCSSFGWLNGSIVAVDYG